MIIFKSEKMKEIKAFKNMFLKICWNSAWRPTTVDQATRIGGMEGVDFSVSIKLILVENKNLP
jgi:hypothetical protein